MDLKETYNNHKSFHNLLLAAFAIIAIFSLILVGQQLGSQQNALTQRSSASEDREFMDGSTNNLLDGFEYVFIDQQLASSSLFEEGNIPNLPEASITPTPIPGRYLSITPTPEPTGSAAGCYAIVEGLAGRLCPTKSSCNPGSYTRWNVQCVPSGNTYSYDTNYCERYRDVNEYAQQLCCNSRAIFEEKMDERKCVTSYTISYDIPCKEYAEQTGQKCQCKYLQDGQKECCIRGVQN